MEILKKGLPLFDLFGMCVGEWLETVENFLCFTVVTVCFVYIPSHWIDFPLFNPFRHLLITQLKHHHTTRLDLHLIDHIHLVHGLWEAIKHEPLHQTVRLIHSIMDQPKDNIIVCCEMLRSEFINMGTEFSCIELLQAYSSDFCFLGDLISDEFSGAYVDESVFSCKHSGDLGAFCCGRTDDEDSGRSLGGVAFNSKFHHSCQLSQQRLPPHRAINLKIEILVNLSNSLHMHEILLF